MLQKSIPSFLAGLHQKRVPGRAKRAKVFVLAEHDPKFVGQLIAEEALSWQVAQLEDLATQEVLHFTGQQGLVWVLHRRTNKGPYSHQSMLEDSGYGWHRDQMGSLWMQMKSQKIDLIEFHFFSADVEAEKGVLVGLELAAYSFKGAQAGGFDFHPQVKLLKLSSPAIIKQAQALGAAINWARHLVNMPPNFLNPISYAQFVKQFFKGDSRFKVSVWDKARLEREKMGLILGVGQGSPNPPCLIHISYQPKGRSKLRPIALVGKGITFDTGGLDIKPSSAMRLMKKDMGGSASCFALAAWAKAAGIQRPLDIYLALAENSVDGKSMRPSDVLVARNGLSVEIHNTDAEGRLVLAEALDVAASQKREPECIIDVATLTGAMRVALGVEIGGMLSNDDVLAERLQKSAQKAGDLTWRLPLYSRYMSSMTSNFADMVNASDGMGGAITAALFLEKFVRRRSWAHFDAYCWTDKPSGALTSAGGNGQMVQCLARFLQDY